MFDSWCLAEDRRYGMVRNTLCIEGLRVDDVAPFPSFGFGLPPHLSAACAVGLAPPSSGCHCSRPTGQGLHRPPSPDSPLVGGSRIISVLKFKFLF